MKVSIEQQIIKLLENEDQRALNLLYENYSDSLYGVILKITNNEEIAEDALQETFVKVWKALSKFRGDSQVYTWIYRIATREALALIKKEKRLQIGDDAFQYHLSADPYFNGDEAMEQLIGVLEKLPERQRTVFQMKYFQDLSFKDISEQLDVSIGSLKASYHHAKEKIKSALNLKDV